MSTTSDRQLQFSSVEAGRNDHWHIYYGRYFVGTINRSYGGWRAWHLGILLGEFIELEEASER